MSAQPSHAVFALPGSTRRDRARFVKDAGWLRAEGFDKLFSFLGRRLARLGRTSTTLPALPRSAQGSAGQA